MNEATRILIVEDSKADLELAKREIRKHLKDCVFEHVETRSDFLKVLDSFEPHLIISDYNMPGFDGMKALRLAQDKAPLTPFIVWTGSLGEDIAAECMKAGANNYIIKENLKRLGPAVIHALEERQLYLERKLAEEKFQSIFENSADGIFQSTPEGQYLSVNPAMARIYGYDSPRDMLESITDIARQIYVDAGERREFIRLLDKSDSVTNFEARNYRKDGSIIWVSTSARVVRDASGRILYYEGFSRDITERRRAEIELQQRNDDLRLINVINESVIRGESLDTIVGMLAKELKRIFSSEGSTIYMIEPDGQSLTMQKYFLSGEITRKIEGLIGSTIPLIHIPVREGGFFHQVISSQRGRITSDPSEVQAWIAEFTETTFLPPAARGVVRKLIPQLYNLLNIKSTIIVPLISDGKTIGLLDVSSSKLFTDDDLQRIEAISGQLTAAIQRQKAIERVRRSEEFLKSVQNALTASIAILDEEGTIVQVNSAWRKFADRNGYTHPDYGVGVNYLEVCDSATGPDAREAPLAAKAIRDVIMGQRREAMLEYPCNSPDEKRWFTLRITRFEDEERMWVVLMHENITERKQAEEALQQSENRYRTVVESQSEFIVRWKPNGKRTFVNEAYCRYFGVDPEQALNSNFMPLIHEDDRPAVEEKISRLFAGAINAETDIHRVIRPDGSIGWQEWTDHAIRDKDGKLIEFQSVGRDITERKQAEDAEREQRALAEALRETAEILNSTLDYGEVLDHILAAVGRVVPHDAATIMLIEKGVAHVARMRGYAERGVDSEIMKIELSMTDTVNLQQMLKTGRPVVVSDTRSYSGWKVIPAAEWIRSNVGAPISVSGEVAGFILLNSETPGFFNPIHAERLEAFANQAALAIRNARLLQQAQEEIAERKQAEKELRASEERFRHLANNIKEVFWVTDAVTDTDLYLSPAYESIWGRPPEMQYQNPQVFIDSILPEDRPAVLKTLEIQRAGKNTEMEYRIMRPDGTIRWIWDRAFPVFDNSGRVVSLTGIAADITERKEAEAALHKRDALLLESQRVAKLGHYRLDIRSGQWESSETLNDIFGIDKNYNTDINGWAEIIHPDQRDEMLAYFTGDVLEKQNAFNREYRIIRKSDGQERWVHGLGQLEFDDEGKPTRMIGTIQDITERKLAEEALRESEERFGSAFEFAPIGIALVSPEGRWMKVNRAICELLGYTEEELLSTTFQTVTHPDDLDTDINYVTQMLAGKINTYQMEKRYIHKSGHLVWVLLSVSLVKDRLGNPKYFISQIQDITERRQAEEQLRKLSRAVEQSASIIVITDTSGNIEYVNPKFTETTGYTAEEALGQNPRLLKSNHTPPENYSQLWKAIKSGREWRGEFINKKKNGELYWESATISPIFNERGETTHFIAVKEDITERKQAEAETKRHLLELEALYENGLAIGHLLEPQEIGERIIETFSRYLSWHHATIRLRKGDTDELDLIAFNLPHENGEDPSDVKRHFTSHVGRVGEGISGWVVQTGQPVRTGNLQDHPHYVHTYENMQSGLYMPLRAGDRVIGVISVESEQRDAFSEQDERLLATLATQAAIAFDNARLYHSIQQERERFLDLFENSPIATWLEDFTGVIAWMDELKAKGVTNLNEYFKSNPEEYKTGMSRIRILDVNHAAVVMNGARDKQELISIVHQLMADDVPSQVMIHELEMIWEGYTSFGFEMSSRKMDGSLISGIQRVYIPANNNQPDYARVIVTSTDITERKRSDTIMQKRLELMEFASHHSLQELMQRTLDEICELTHSRISFLQLLRDDEKTPGLHLWSTEAASLFSIPEGQRTRHSVDQAGVWADAVRQRRSVIQNDYASLPDRKGLPEGHAELIREVMIPIIRNDKVMAVVGIGNKPTSYTREDVEIAERFADHAWDIMERKQMEAALAEERNLLAKHVEERTADLSRANSNLARALRVKDEFLANMSHELRTPLNAILGLSESLAEQVAGTLNEKQLKYVTTISESGHHLLSLINDILDLAKIEAGQITLDINKVDVNSVCQASLRMIKQMAQKKNLEVSLEIDGGVGLMWADERRLKQMMVNLLSNAVKFTPEGGKIGLKVMGEFEENKVLITVWDTGIGIKENDFQHLFKPFVQLDSGLARESTGTGLGLALVAQMARLHGGSVSVTSDPGKGSQFTITLPWEPALAADTVERMKTTGKFRAIRPDMHQETILLIEDTEDIVMMIKDYLEQAGYKVASAQDGIEGIEQAKLVHPDLILMDIQMPRMDGFETTQRLRQDPEFKYTPIIALTALAMPNDRERCLAAGMDEYISKPVNLRALVKIIQNCLSFREQKTRPR